MQFFLTGSHGENRKAHSDIDLIIILKNNHLEIRYIYTWIGNIFADIYFFDIENVEEILKTSNPDLRKHELNHLLYTWIKTGTIIFDKSKKLTEMKSIIKEFEVSTNMKIDAWENINYSYESNTRYFESNDPIYHEALEMRLLWTVSSLPRDYLTFRNKHWQGEKAAINYFKSNDPIFYKSFCNFLQSKDLINRFRHYKEMVDIVLFLDPNYKKWQRNEVLEKSLCCSLGKTPEIVEFWHKLLKGTE